MAKSARASVVKKNHRNLRATVFGPAHDARTARLSAKLQELVAKPKPETEKPMDLDDKPDAPLHDKSKNNNLDEMDLDGLGAKLNTSKSASRKRKADSKVRKISKRKKPRNSVVFPSEIARRRKMAAGKKKR